MKFYFYNFCNNRFFLLDVILQRLHPEKLTRHCRTKKFTFEINSRQTLNKNGSESIAERNRLFQGSPNYGPRAGCGQQIK